jgi:hypothetical protein
MAVMSEREFEGLRGLVRRRYARSGQAPDVVEALNEHNDRVLEHVEEICAGEKLDESSLQLVKTIAILHDIAKADTHLMLHADIGGDDAAAALRELGKDEAFIAEVQRGIRCHMGPFPFIEEEAKKYAERTGDHLHLPRPDTEIEKLFYDADMLALMDIEGIEKVVVLRQTTQDFIAEDEETSTAEGITPRAAAYRSALQSCERAAATLFSATARAIGARLVAEAEGYVAQRLAAESAGR